MRHVEAAGSAHRHLAWAVLACVLGATACQDDGPVRDTPSADAALAAAPASAPREGPRSDAGTVGGDGSPIRLLPLTRADLDANPLSGELSSLLALEQLTYLDLARTGATTLFAFAPAELHALFADGNAIIDLSPLAAHTKLESIGLADNQITTVAPIADAPFWQHNCVIADLDGNPLDAESLGTILPALCEAFDSISWDGGDCFACQGMP